MATQVDNSGPLAGGSLRAARRRMGAGLFWGALMLLVLALWVANRDLETPILVVGPLLLLAAAALILSVRLCFGGPAADAPEESARATLLRQRRTLALCLFGAAAL